MTTATGPLPEGWTQHVDQSGKTFYYNSRTNQRYARATILLTRHLFSKWDRPQAVSSMAQQALDDSPGKEHEDAESGKKYYHNIDTNETTWDMPQEYKVCCQLEITYN